MILIIFILKDNYIPKLFKHSKYILGGYAVTQVENSVSHSSYNIYFKWQFIIIAKAFLKLPKKTSV